MSRPSDTDAAVLRLEREAVQAFLAEQRSADDIGVREDMITASTIYLADLEQHISTLNDRSIAQSNQRALGSDIHLITEALRQEGTALEDRQLALRLSHLSEESRDADSDNSSSSGSPDRASVAASASCISTNTAPTHVSGATKRKRLASQPVVNIRTLFK